MGELSDRRTQTEKRINQLSEHLEPAEKIAAGKASVYATGSFGRREASQSSDLDLFIVGKPGDIDDKGKEKRPLSKLDEILVKAKLIELTRDLGIKDFSGDGRYLVYYSVQDLTSTLGTPDDDVLNTFTARLLLLLESFPLVERGVYEDVIKQVIDAYWRDFEDHSSSFMPAFLANDILRLWRTFCVNYEARTVRVPEIEKAKGKTTNYKLKHSRMLTCYSALLYLLAVYVEKGTVQQADAFHMTQLTPTSRLDWLSSHEGAASARSVLEKLLSKYEEFLATTSDGDSKLIERFMDREQSHRLMNAAYEFGDLMFDALAAIGGSNRFYRLLVV
ncbi:nucleotidyltransferase domain-containing protein [Bradyrhizobium sp. WD16]|uniref:nucleotidyltransferase domain-containing protein n=1 Tax=Bradyrhizobium sp. WD16 TaxID=1521768 RepID=UPI0020A5143B|nr:nucleotidyltransferase domain-containing protein [Bradyrhizobium sp. WD16]